LYGGARQVAYLLEGLANYPGEHVLVCAKGAEIDKAVANLHIKTVPLPLGGDFDLGFIWRLRQIIREERPDLMHLHSRRGDMLAALAGRWERLPTIHSRRVDNPPSRLDLRLKFPLFGKIVAISEGIRKVLLRAGVPAEQVLCVPSAVDTRRFRPLCSRESVLQEFGLKSDARLLGMVAQMIPRKGHDVLFEALPAILQEHPKTQALLFGRGPLDEELRRRAGERGLKWNVHFLGFRHDLENIIPCLDLLVHPAYMEGLGVSLLEAASCGVPIVASQVGGIPEIVLDGVNGHLIKPGDSASLARLVVELLDRPERLIELGKAGRERVLEKFSIERMVEGNFGVYAEFDPQ
jgi:glycosyltransferase involved in cell wall biosynthesis